MVFLYNLPVYIGSKLWDISSKTIVIKKGDFKLNIGENISSIIEKATAYMTFSPKPVICIKGFYKGRFPSPRELQQIKILHIKGFKPARAKISSFKSSRGKLPKIKLTIPKYLESKNIKVNKIYFFLLNFLDTRGYALRQKVNIYPGRTSISCGMWKITLDKKPNFNDIRKNLNHTKGFAITHIGKIEKHDGKTFAAKDADFLLESLFWLLSFCCSRFIGIPIQWGFYKNQLVWKKYINHPVSHWRENLYPWFPENKPQCLNYLLPSFTQKFLDPLWKKALKVSIKWLIQSQERPLCPGDIVLIKSALDMLSQCFFENDSTHNNIKKLIAECKIPQYLSYYGIDSDDINLLSNFRHYLLSSRKHNPSNIKKLLYLGLWYLELSILYILNYTGPYRNRMRLFTKKFPYKETEKVPWIL